MSSWGNKDNVQLTGTVTTTNSTDTVRGFSSAVFEDEVSAGDYIVIAAKKYQVANVTSNTLIHTTDLTSTNSSNVKAFVQQGPKYIANVSFPANNYSIQNVLGVDRNEIANASANANVSHTGWSHFITYEDANGTIRKKSEVLVAMSKNFNANVEGYIQADYTPDDDTLQSNVAP